MHGVTYIHALRVRLASCTNALWLTTAGVFGAHRDDVRHALECTAVSAAVILRNGGHTVRLDGAAHNGRAAVSRRHQLRP